MKLADRLMAPVNTAVISILGLGEFIMGLWLTLPFNSLCMGNINWIPEWIIGIILISIGLLTVKYSVKTDLFKLEWVSKIAFIFWIVSVVLMMITGIASLGWIIALIFSVYCFMISLNIRVNRRVIK